MNLFDITPDCDPFNPGMRGKRTRNDGPRDVYPNELRAYLNWLAEREGIAVPANARYCARGIVVGGIVDKRGDTGGTVVLAMPGYGVPQVVTCEIVDDAGEVVKSFPLPADRSGKLPMTAKQVQEWSGLAPARKARARKSAPVAPAAVSAAIAPQSEPEAVAAPERAENAPEAISTDVVAALVARIEALEAIAAPLVAVNDVAATPIEEIVHAPAPRRSAAHERAIRRAWAERRTARLQRAIAEDHMRMREMVQAELRDVVAKRISSAQRARRMVEAFRKDRDGARQALSVARADAAKLRKDIADPTQPERASDLSRLLRERDTARQACAALEQRAQRSEEALSRFADSYDATLSRALRAEAELRSRAG